jgi:recombination protein RecR
MKDILPKQINELSDLLSSIPGIGIKTAERIAFYMTTSKDNIVEKLIEVLINIRDNVKVCSECGMVSDTDPCSICSSNERNKKVICVVEKPSDVVMIEKTGEFNGLYHVLGGVISPLEGVGPSDIRIQKLVERVEKLGIEEVFFALDPDSEGETTMTFIISKLRNMSDLKITTIAKGIPVGGNIEYSDPYTLSKAIRFRTKLNDNL